MNKHSHSSLRESRFITAVNNAIINIMLITHNYLQFNKPNSSSTKLQLLCVKMKNKYDMRGTVDPKIISVNAFLSSVEHKTGFLEKV